MKKIIVIMLLLVPAFGFSQDISDYLILQDIGQYKLSTPQKMIPGLAPIGGPKQYDGAGIISGAGHFIDHVDKTYETMYLGGGEKASPTVIVTQHTGSDSDQWLMHELSRDFRNYFGLPDDSFIASQIVNNTIIALSVAGYTYRWLSEDRVIQIQYHDSQMEKPEPLEIVNVYLAKHPSTLPEMSSADLRTEANQTSWIKDEMTRRLWLCDKWLAYSQTGNVEISDLVQELADHLTVFLQYREKYHSISAKEELALIDDYMLADNKTALETKLAEYKTWWTDHKNDPIRLP